MIPKGHGLEDAWERWISRKAKQLKRHQPPEELWITIETRLRAEMEKSSHGQAEADRDSQAHRLLRYFHRTVTRQYAWRIGFAAVAISILIALSFPSLRRGLISGLASRSNNALTRIDSDLARAEREYQKAIERLIRLAEQNEKNIEPGLLALYREKLALVDDSILECQQALKTNYRNPAAHGALLYCYRQKMETLRSMIQMKS